MEQFPTSDADQYEKKLIRLESTTKLLKQDKLDDEEESEQEEDDLEDENNEDEKPSQGKGGPPDGTQPQADQKVALYYHTHELAGTVPRSAH